MAESLFRGMLQEKLPNEAQDWKVRSAGTWTVDGEPAATGARNTMLLFGLSLEDHQSAQVTYQMMNDYNLILVMEKGHKEALQIEFPDRAERIFLLSEMVGGKYEIEDPIGGEPARYVTIARQIDSLLEQGWERIFSLAQIS
jgi:protein-tyrosine-phosphatase